MCSQTRWKPPEVAERGISSPSRLTKVDAGIIKDCCENYLAPDPVPKSETGRYDVIIQRFEARSSYLLSLSDVDFAKEHIALLPQSLPSPTLPRDQLVEALLKEEFGSAISERLTSQSSSEIKKEREKRTRREKYELAVTDAREAREECVWCWPQTIPKDIVHGCLNAYYEGSRWTMPPVQLLCMFKTATRR